MPRFSIVTTCKGRLAHLKQSLPRFLVQADTEVVVVDYDCPEDTAAVVERDFPDANVVAIDDAPHFNIAEARNLGATTAVGDWLVFLDADILVAPDMMARLAEANPGPGHYYRFPNVKPLTFELWGSCVVRREDFAAVQGYDTIMQGYGGEDTDFYARLERRGLKRGALDPTLLERILFHGDAARGRYHAKRDITLTSRINAAYRLAKSALLRQYDLPELPESLRRSIYALVETRVTEAIGAGKTTVQIAIPLGPDHEVTPLWEWEATRYIFLDLKPRDWGQTPGTEE